MDAVAAHTDVLLGRLKLSARRATERAIVGVISSGVGIVEPRDPGRQVGDGGPQASHRGDQAVIERWELVDVSVIEPPRRARPIVVIGHHPRRSLHPERHEQPFGDVVLDAAPGHSMHDAAQHRVAEVRVLVGRSGRLGKHWPGGDDRVELVIGEVEVTVGPVVVGDEPARHRQQIAHRDRRSIGGRAAEQGEFGDELPDRVVEAKRTLVTQCQRRCGRERLGHRGDPIHGVFVDIADRSGDLEHLVAYDTPRDRRAMMLFSQG